MNEQIMVYHTMEFCSPGKKGASPNMHNNMDKSQKNFNFFGKMFLLFIHFISELMNCPFEFSCDSLNSFMTASSSSSSSFFFNCLCCQMILFYILFLTARGLRCCAWTFSICAEPGLLFSVVCGLFIAVASLTGEHRL